MLGRLEMSIEDCIEKYISMSDRIFRKKRHRLKINTDIQGRFDTGELEESIKQIIKDCGLPEDEKMRSPRQIQGGKRFCKVYVSSIAAFGHLVDGFGKFRMCVVW
jgi:ABC-type oligopeptide transport system ATPase subunit